MFELIDMIIVRPIVNLLFVIYNLVGDFGLAIIIFTVIVKFAMWPLIKRQLHQTKQMRKIQPELAEIKKNCKGNRQLESLQMMDLYKKNNIKPFRSMLTLIIQLPVFIALFTAINVMVRPTGPETLSVEKSAYSFIQPLERINSLVNQQNDYFAAVESDAETAEYSFKPKLFNTLDLSTTAGFSSVDSIIILFLALCAAGTQFIMARQQNTSSKSQKRSFKQIMKDAAEGKEADQSELNSVVSGQMTTFMPIMMLFIMINLPGALVMYYLLTNLITVVQQKIILNRRVDEMERIADKKILKELRTMEEAQIVEKGPKNKQNITRIKASSKKRRR